MRISSYSARFIALLVAIFGIYGCGEEAYKNRTAKGVKYTDVKEGDGKEAKIGDHIYFHYVSYLPNGSVLEDTHNDPQPKQIMLGFKQNIVGLDEGLQGIKPGTVRHLWIPSELAYGPDGIAYKGIPSNADLRYEVEVEKIVPKEEFAAQLEQQKLEEEKLAKAPVRGTEVPEKDQKPIKTDSGLQYIDQRIGEGLLARRGNTVVVNYLGTLKNGDKFDSSYDRKEPFSFQLGRGQVIKGWDEGVAGMKVGGSDKLIIPPGLAYGEKSAGKIPPNSELTFEVELLRVKVR